MTRRQRGSGTIERIEQQLADGTIKIMLRPRLTTSNGRKSLGFTESIEAADALLDAARSEVLVRDEASRLTLRTWGVRFLDRREREEYRSIDDDRSRWSQHIEGDPIADVPLVRVTRRDVIEWVDRLCAKWAADRRDRRKLGKGTVQNTLDLLRAALEMATERQVIAANHATDVKVPKRSAPTAEPWTYLEFAEQEMLWACKAIPMHHKLWMQIAVGTGIREGEQFNMLLRDVRIDGPEPEIVVRFGSKEHGPKSTRGKVKIRRVPLFGLGLQAMRAWLAMLPSYCPNNPLGLVFSRADRRASPARKAPPRHTPRR